MPQQPEARLRDGREALSVGNIFKTYQANGKPPMPEGWTVEFTFKTARDHANERLTSEDIERKSAD